MVEEQIGYSIYCDGEDCQELFEDYNGNSVFEEEPTDEELEEAGWTVDDDHHFCPNCKRS